jgi:solute carrier family 13 (sodium-dependent dicarboxylate transporter), member 2/3/5
MSDVAATSDELSLGRLTPGEERFEALRKRAGFVLGPLTFFGIWYSHFPGLSEPAHRLAAVMATTAVLWICESIPMPMTAMLAAAACAILRIAPAKEVFAPFADFIMFLFIGSFILARAVFVHGLDRRFAYAVLAQPWIGARPGRILFGFGATTAFMSAWVSNTATTAMMFAIGMSILSVFFRDDKGAPRIDRRYATGLMLMTSFAASIGGLATPIGSPPNLIGIGLLKNTLVDPATGKSTFDISFFQWSMLGFPLVIVMYLFLFTYLNKFCPAGVAEIPGSAELLRERRRGLGPWTAGQYSTIFAALLTVTLWILPGIAFLLFGGNSPQYAFLRDTLNEGAVALVGAGLLFLLPGNREGRAVSWDDAAKIDWGIVFLYGGGFALGALADKTGLAAAIGRNLCDHLPTQSSLGILIFATTIAVLVSETTSNTASAQIIVPVIIPLAIAAGVDPVEPALGAIFGASLGFMLPVSTPCNAIVYGSGYIPLTRMIRYGLILDLVGIVVTVIIIRFGLPIVRGLGG